MRKGEGGEAEKTLNGEGGSIRKRGGRVQTGRAMLKRDSSSNLTALKQCLSKQMHKPLALSRAGFSVPGFDSKCFEVAKSDEMWLFLVPMSTISCSLR